MKLSLIALVAVALAGCGAEPSDDWSESESNQSSGSATTDVDRLKALTPITMRSSGVLPPAEEARRGGFVQGFFSGKDDDGRACSVHVVHYTRATLPEVYIHAWKDADAKGARRYDDDFDHNVSGVEVEDVIEFGAIHQVSLSRLTEDARVRFSAGSMFMKERQIVKSSGGDEEHDVEIEVNKFDEAGGGIVIRVKKTFADDVVSCHDLVPRATVTP